MASAKYLWVYPKNKLPYLEFCYIFYGDEKSYQKFIEGAGGLSMKDIMKKTVKFKKEEEEWHSKKRSQPTT